MNVLRTVSHVLVMAAMVFTSNGLAIEFRKYTGPAAIGTGSIFIKEKRAAAIFGDKIVSPRNQVVISKAFVGGIGHFIANPICDPKKVAGYVIVNGLLQSVENNKIQNFFIELGKENLSESAASVVQELEPVLADMIFDYGATKIINAELASKDKLIYKVLNHYKFTLGGMAVASYQKEDAHLLKSSIETGGYVLDNIHRYKCMVEKEKRDDGRGLTTGDFVYYEGVAKDVAKHLVINYTIRKGSQALHDQGITFEAVANKCDVLPASMAYYVNPAVRYVAEKATHPEVVTYFCRIINV